MLIKVLMFRAQATSANARNTVNRLESLVLIIRLTGKGKQLSWCLLKCLIISCFKMMKPLNVKKPIFSKIMSLEKVKIQMTWSWILGIHDERPDPKCSKSKINVMIYNQSTSEIFLFQRELQLGHQLTSLDTVLLSIHWAVLQPINLFQAKVDKVETFSAQTPTAQLEQQPTIKTYYLYKILQALQITSQICTTIPTPASISTAVSLALVSSLNINNPLIKLKEQPFASKSLMNLLSKFCFKMSLLKSGNSSLKFNMEVFFKLNKCLKLKNQNMIKEKRWKSHMTVCKIKRVLRLSNKFQLCHWALKFIPSVCRNLGKC